ncbi:uncharacterized protein LOC123541758 isoform X1 [Mercenaria mercenaria]|uniref:uncharacterized protein LOC123541758 isoform X1 n=1 Tax=Mercenaria mercenaria TaxID=6596 RepID=UPI00234EC207|nr:uncharacterized protein LOC123541758 isoform X1 [Mercenaria mercenaria]
MRGVGDRRAGIELDEIKENENVYEELDKKCINSDTYDNEKTEKKTKKENMDTTKVVIVLLCVVVAALVVAVATVSSVVYFGVTDGGWTDWEDWRACSVTCGTGFTTRIRTCSNPRPSIMGRYCDGTSLQVQSCNNTSCSVTDGGWTGWEDWGACSVTCGAGITTRIRSCSNPRPSVMGRYCDGTFVQVQTCNSGSCSGDSVGFSVYGPYPNSGGNSLTFKRTLYNNNDVFNMTSGEFVCQKVGLYLFISTLLRTNDTISSLSCKYYKNYDMSIAYGSHASSNNASDNPSGTTSILYYLKPGDRVYLGSCRGMNYMARGSGFTGLLINPMH